MSRGCSTREVFVAVGNKYMWVKSPDANMAITPTGWGNSSQFTNGALGTVATRYGAKGYSLGWTYLKDQQAKDLTMLFAYAGTDPVFYLDPFASDNILSVLAGTPAMLAETYSPVAYTTTGEALATSEVSSYPQGRALVFEAASGPDMYTERIVIPAGKTLSVWATGVDTDKVLKVNGTAVAPTTLVQVSATATDNKPVNLTIGNPLGVAARIEWVRAVIRDTGTDVALSDYAPPMGGGNMRVSPQSFSLTGISANTDTYAAGVELKEVWSWL